MALTIVRDMQEADGYFVGTCSHVNESPQIDANGARRLAWLQGRFAQGDRVKVALADGKPVGFLHLSPIEISPLGPLGEDLSVITCMFVGWNSQGRGIGKALVQAAVEESSRGGRQGIVTLAYDHDFWFMPARFFEKQGFIPICRKDTQVIQWKPFSESAVPPTFLVPDCRYEPIPGKIVVDLFWMTFCGAEDREVVVRVVSEFSDVVVREHCSDDREVLLRYQIPRGVYLGGQKIDWDYEDPERGFRKAIAGARGMPLES